MKILFVQVEFLQFANSLPWTYHCHVGMAQALKRAGHEVDVALTAQPALLGRLADEGDYDLAVVNDLVHGFARTDPSCCPIPTRVLRRLRARGVPILGTLIESVFHAPGEAVDDVLQRERQNAIEQAAVWLDFIVSYDRFDAGALREMGCRALWTPFFTQAPPEPPPAEVSRSLIFLGAMYAKRTQFIARAGVEGRIACGYIDYGAPFREAFDRMIETVRQPGADAAASLELVTMYKQAVFHIYARQLRAHALIVNLPTIFKGIPCRLVEALAMGRPSLSPRPRHADERALLATIPARACMLYDDDRPEQFAPLLDAAAERVLDADDAASLQAFFATSPFAPDRFAAHLVAFVTGQRSAEAIEAGYLQPSRAAALAD